MKQFFIDREDLKNLRLDLFLIRNFSQLSRSKIQKFIKGGKVDLLRSAKLVTPLNCSELLRLGDSITTNFEEKNLEEVKVVKNSKISLDILYEDSDILVLNKESGLLVHSGSHFFSETLVDALLTYNKKQFSKLISKEDKYIRPGIVHRLDKLTSGTMVVAKNKFSLLKLKKSFADREVNKIYLGLIWGVFKSGEGRVRTYIRRNPKFYDKMMSDKREGKEAISYYKVLRETKEVSLVKFRLETGRTHQLRVHCHSLHCPLVGDPLYGLKKKDREYSFISRLMLHSWRLKVQHPRRGELLTFTSPLSEEFLSICNQFGIKIKR